MSNSQNAAANVKTLAEMTGLTEEVCEEMLAVHNGNLEQAVNAWLEGGEINDYVDPELDAKPAPPPSKNAVFTKSTEKCILTLMVLNEFAAVFDPLEKIPKDVVYLITTQCFSLFAGRTFTLLGQSVSGKTDGPVSVASFNYPMSICVDPSKNIILTDYTDHLVRRCSSDIEQVITLAGSGMPGLKDEKGKEAAFHNPIGICADAFGDVFVCDYGNNKIRKIKPDGTVSVYPNAKVDGGGFADGLLAKFNGPYGVCIDLEGNLLVADCQNHKIRKICKDSLEVTTIAGSSIGYLDGESGDAQFSCPVCLAVEPNGNIIVSDFNQSKIRRITMPSGRVSTLAGSDSGYADGPGNVAKFQNPVGICIMGNDVIVADYGNAVIRRVSLTDGQVSTICGSDKGDEDGDESEAKFRSPIGICNYSAGVVLVTDASNHKVKKVFV